ncbi:MAG: ATP-binding protein [Saprospiraceae bacterium]|nr:ATP-binding protein [Saprospiraceae bacterium]
MHLFLNKYLLLIFAILVCALTGYQIERLAKQAPNVEDYAKSFENKLHKTEEEFNRVIKDKNFLDLAVNELLSEDSIVQYQAKPFTLLIYSEYDSLIFWSNNKISPYRSDIKYVNDRISEKYKIRGSLYLKIQAPYEVKKNNRVYSYNLVGLIPIYARYPIQNNYLSDHFELMPKQFSDYIIATDKESNYEIRDLSGTKITYLTAKKNYPSQPFIIWAFVLYFITSFLTILLVQWFSSYLRKTNGTVLGICSMILGIIVLRILGVYLNFPNVIDDIEVFNIKFSPYRELWFRSLGEFILDVILLFWGVLFIRNSLRKVPLRIPDSVDMQYGVITLSYVVLATSIWGIYNILRVVILQSSISFEFSDLSKLDFFSFVALGTIAFLFLGLFILNNQLFRIHRNYVISDKNRAILLVIVWSLWLIFWIAIGLSFIKILVFSGILFLYVFLLNFFVSLDDTSFLWVGVWLTFFAGFSTFLFEDINTEKDLLLRKTFAKRVASERNFEMEKLFDQIGEEILEDGYFKIYFASIVIPRRQAPERILYRYLDNNFFGRFDYNIHIYDRDNEIITPRDGTEKYYSEFSSIINDKNNTIKVGQKDIYFHSDPEGSYRYIAHFPIKEKGNLLGTIFIEFLPKKGSKKSNIYEELLSLPKVRLEQLYDKYSYAMYKLNVLVEEHNDNFPSTFNLAQEQIQDDSYKIVYDKEGLGYVLYKGKNGYVSVVTLPSRQFLSVSIFSYIYVFGVLILVLILALDYLYNKLVRKKSLLGFNFDNSLRDKIQRGILLMTLTSFVIVAIITIIYSRQEYNDYHRSRLKRKIDSTAENALLHILQNSDKEKISIPDPSDLSKIHSIDVNLYDLKGRLISTSEDAVFERRLLGRQMNRVAFFKMLSGENEFIQSEEINHFEYLAAYVPLKDKDDKTIAYLNLPYDLAGSSTTQSQAQETAQFLGALLNAYVMLLILAGGGAFLIANTIADPLRVIGEKLDKVKLGTKNEAIQWNNNDEIGELIKQYNKMVAALEESAKELTRTQRESAWRDMAKQVAHEIKNPLTPMKLNIQLLQRVLSINPEKAQKMVGRVSSALIEQIDNLAHIASEFSNFAKMPTAHNEVLNLKELIQSVYDLFKEEENIQLSLDLPHIENVVIFADKNQMMRVLNNLVKNAIQAIPEDRDGLVDISLKIIDNKALIEVRDNGCGIPDHRREDVFIPNFTTKNSGTGIGLSMSKTIVDMAQGKIYLESELDKGTQFFVELPLYLEGEA